MIPILRVLTRKSKLKFGKYKDYTVQQLLDLKRSKDLIAPYYKLTSITYVEDVLLELKITEEFRIKKPSKNLEVYNKFMKSEKHNRGSYNWVFSADKLMRESRPLSRGQLMRINQHS